MEYNHKEIEERWQKFWADTKTFTAKNNSDSPKYYVLDMFPYPSGAGLHVGHPLGYIASDIYSRYKRAQGFNVLHPMGYDSFGLPAEQYAIQTGQHPAVTTEQNIKRYREQLDKLGFSFDWDRQVKTSDPSYYKWTQWIFLQLFNSWYNPETDKAEPIDSLIKKFESERSDWKTLSEKEKSDVLMDYRIAYLGEAFVNWCPALGTVLANDEVKDGVSERGGYPVERKLMKQWSMRITAYAERLLTGLDSIDWSESIKEAQRNWIGKSEGCSIRFKIRHPELVSGSDNEMLKQVQHDDTTIEVFTTRPDTLFGITFLTLAPEHELVSKITTEENKQQVEAYLNYAKNRSERDRQADVKKITGQFTGAYAIHPFTGKQIPIWVGDYVLAGYGTGAVMAVPGGDQRDWNFAKHFGLPIIPVIEGSDIEKEANESKEGKMINSDFLNGLQVKEAIKKIIAEIEKRGLGKGKINYRLRDAAFGRQRYWGEPIPIYYKDGIPFAVDEKDLPIVLPEVDKFLPTEDGEPPLARAKDWTYTPHPQPFSKGEGSREPQTSGAVSDSLSFGEGRGEAKEAYPLETTTMPGWAGSSWYYLRYMDPHNEKEFVSKAAADYWKDVDFYLGGSEHATGHLLYVRFWTKFLKDRGFISIEEPAKKLVNQGMIQGVSEFAWVTVSKEVLGKLLSVVNISSDFIEQYEGPAYLSADLVGEVYKIAMKDPEVNTKYSFLKQVNNSTFPIQARKQDRNDVNDLVALDLNVVFNVWPDRKEAVFISQGCALIKNRLIDFENGKSKDFFSRGTIDKMSKSKHNVVNPDELVEKFGADTLRMYEMFLGPLEQSKPWNTNGITGVSGFLKKFWKLYLNTSEEKASAAELKILHNTIKKITDDIEKLSFNTSVSTFMICVNELTDLKCNKREILEPLVILIAPFAPHIAEELWKNFGNNESVTFAKWPEYKEEYTVENSFSYPVSFNGKTRFFHELDVALSKEDVEKEVMALEQTQKYLEGKQPKKVIVVPKKIVNIVV
ncbi:MAG: Valine--tRNA ligase [Bacteroidia bacterium]|nr:Valine--tRNA ligase [Bacteroidia bacterium]